MRRKNALELVHIYVCYVDAKSHAGAQCFVTFIDYYNRNLWAFVLKTKDQVLSVFKEFQARAERESKQKLKAVRTDIGGEYKGQLCCLVRTEAYMCLDIFYYAKQTTRIERETHFLALMESFRLLYIDEDYYNNALYHSVRNSAYILEP